MCNDGEFRLNSYCSRNGLPTVLKASKLIRSSILVTIEGTSHRHHKIAESFHVDVVWFKMWKLFGLPLYLASTSLQPILHRSWITYGLLMDYSGIAYVLLVDCS
jgi:hypothetical protein